MGEGWGGMTDQATERKFGAEAAGAVELATAAKERLVTRLMMPAGCRAYLRRRLANEFPEIVDGFIKEAKKGSCPHVKLATEFLRPTRKGTTRRKSEATRILDDLLGE